MLDFEKELEKLLKMESPDDIPNIDLLHTPFAQPDRTLLTGIGKQQTELSLQIEEIYDIIKKTDEQAEALRTQNNNADKLVAAVVGLCDIIEDFRAFAQSDPDLSRQSDIMWKNAGILLQKCAVTRIGDAGEPLDPVLHSVAGLSPDAQREHVARVLQTGYRYLDKIIRKAAVLIGTGTSE